MKIKKVLLVILVSSTLALPKIVSADTYGLYPKKAESLSSLNSTTSFEFIEGTSDFTFEIPKDSIVKLSLSTDTTCFFKVSKKKFLSSSVDRLKKGTYKIHVDTEGNGTLSVNYFPLSQLKVTYSDGGYFLSNNLDDELESVKFGKKDMIDYGNTYFFESKEKEHYTITLKYKGVKIKIKDGVVCD